MDETVNLSAFGTARRQFLQAVGRDPAVGPSNPDEQDLSPLLDHLQVAVGPYDVEPQTVQLACELTRLEQDLAPQQKQILLVLLVACLVNQQRGSTRMPARGEQGRACLGPILEGLFSGAEFAELTPQRLMEGIDEALATGAFPTVIGRTGDYRPLLFVEPYLYHQKLLHLEDSFAGTLRRRLETADIEPLADRETVDAAIRDVLAHQAIVDEQPIRLAPSQEEAVRKAVEAPLAIISGGPGTGKTTVIVSILRVLVRLGMPIESIALAAPTGKAANRMWESIRDGLTRIPADQQTDADQKVPLVPEARTLHRLLGYSPASETFRYHENNRLSEQVVIVDEASMIDLYMMEQLVRALWGKPGQEPATGKSEPRLARLILLGDADQLPSVEAGAVLRDLVGKPPEVPSPVEPCVVRLTESHRAGGNLLGVATRVNQFDPAKEPQADLFVPGSTPETAHVVTARRDVDGLAFEEVEFLSTVEETDAAGPVQDGRAVRNRFLRRWYKKFLLVGTSLHDLAARTYHVGPDGFPDDEAALLEQVFADYGRFRILCLTNVYRTGATEINDLFHHWMVEDHDRSDGLMPEFCHGEPVMMLKNDYQKRIYNGDQGLVLWVQSGSAAPHRMAVFPRTDRFAAFHLDSLRGRISHSFAMTVHKSQGSEFDHVALILPENDLPINTREILYTGITRAKRSVTILGDRRVLAQGVRKRVERYSGIAEKLAAIGGNN